MSSAAPNALHRPPDAWAASFAPIALFVAMQLAVLAVCLLHVPLAAGVADGEALLVRAMLLVQMCTAALLAGSSQHARVTSFLLIATVWPALILCAAVTASPLGPVLAASAGVSLWIAGLNGWCQTVKAAWLAAIVRMVALVVSAGAVATEYFAIEFNGEATGHGLSAALDWFPVQLVWVVASGTFVWARLAIWIGLLTLGILPPAIAILRRKPVSV